MAKNLVIVESPAKAKTIEGYLGSDYVVKASIGHVRDLPRNDMAVNEANNFDVTYEIYPDAEKVVNELKKLAKEAIKDNKFVWLATDEDREGEAISWHLLEAMKIDEY
jgi:DNA topoisomerase-1